MIEPIFKVKTEIDKGSYCRFVVEPLVKGYGYTLGNALRRVLLSSLQGAAITHVEINNISHLFTTIDGMKENVIDLILNLKKVRIKATVDEAKTIYLDAKGVKEIKAADLQPEGGLEIVNKELVLCHLTDKKAHLKMKLTVGRGYRYVLAEELERPHLGVIPIDAVFSPVIKVNYKVEATRVGRETDWDKLILDVTTDGAISPSEAVEKASLILAKHFSHLTSGGEKVTKKVAGPKEKTKKSDQEEGTSLEELALSPRITNALKKADIFTVEKLKRLSKEELGTVKNLGPKSIEEIKKVLKKK